MDSLGAAWLASCGRIPCVIVPPLPRRRDAMEHSSHLTREVVSVAHRWMCHCGIVCIIAGPVAEHGFRMSEPASERGLPLV